MISKKITLKVLLLSAALIASPVMYAQEEVEELSSPVTQVSAAKHCGAHLLTDSVAYIVSFASFLLSCAIAERAFKNSKVRFLSIEGKEYPVYLGCALALYIQYKTPQWTDDYILKLGRKRTLGQNLWTFLQRSVGAFVFSLPVVNPLGVLFSESWQMESDRYDAEKKSKKNEQELAAV